MTSSASQRSSIRGSLLVAGVAGLAAAAVAVALHSVSRVVDLFVVAPMAGGYAIGWVTAGGVRRAAFARPVAAGLIAALATLGAHAGASALAYRAHENRALDKAERIELLRASIGNAEPGVAPGDSYLEFLSDQLGLGGAAHPVRAARPSVLGAAGAIALLCVEVIASMALAAAVARGEASEPVCPRCGQWRRGALLGAIAQGRAAPLIAALDAGNADLSPHLEPPDTPEEERLFLFTCGRGHDSGGVLRIIEQRIHRRGRGYRRIVAERELARSQRRDLEVAFSDEGHG